ncbi:NADPH-dependent 7-cyano-7-deazaguanine reductase QueF [Carboxylicivirga mesophila]|uniref:NADPH-dependent 7-cyano-7-deazaguanine reductase QueF n=1 Tax=Carboxylicivirga mesophila TaxID=1166478 RepID=A0ABS5K8V7_9BACT|nr:NADPH-dependent 7-cyano-7-deazaguanine reductase QueF [Carboxylicivirga mesophila]MBS2210828.1 NADPH-dependent 7-cyano-7-deazaguanine reductase QueF [Carboxylicivirga mesophila]
MISSEGKFLGKQVDYPQNYAPEMLVAVPRHFNRTQYNLHEDSLPFIGVDVWHAYELSFLTNNGLPVTGLLKVVYSATSKNIVESKSFKLYLNSFNMHRFGNTMQEGLKEVLSLIKKDLSHLMDTDISLHFFRQDCAKTAYDFADYRVLENMVNADIIKFEHYNENPDLLKTSGIAGELNVASHLLRSNCKITNQPDWGTAYIHIKGQELPTGESLLQYIVSIRNENHFHEEICEMLYKRLWDIFKPDELAVSCIYTRRGGIDICPIRVSHEHLLPRYLSDTSVLSHKLLRQ